jgi:hypothetical protein
MRSSKICLVLVVIVVALFVWKLLPSSLLGNPTLLMVVQGGSATGKGILQIPITRTDKAEYSLRASIDWNKNGIIEEHERLTGDVSFVPKRGDSQNVALTLPSDAKKASSYLVELNVSDIGDRPLIQTYTLQLETYDIGDLVDMSTVTNPESAMKGDTVVRNAKPPEAPKAEGVPTNFSNLCSQQHYPYGRG